jgi:hypothetical protein
MSDKGWYAVWETVLIVVMGIIVLAWALGLF